MAGVTRVKNLDRLRRKLAAIPKAVRKEIHAALETGAAEISAAAKQLAPVADSDLKNSIGYTFGEFIAENANVRGVTRSGSLGDPELSVTIHAGDAKAFYAAFVEFGTNPHPQGGMFAGTEHPGTPPQPFFFPAYRLKKKRVKSRIARATRKAVRDVVKGGGA